jgi:predicted ATPase/signal transduction histidine kinase/CheY-like chemotaxis protein
LVCGGAGAARRSDESAGPDTTAMELEGREVAKAQPTSPETTVTGYEILESLGATTGSALVRARRLVDGAPVLLKLLDARPVDSAALARLRKEYALFDALRLAVIPRPLALITEPPPCIVLADPGGGLLEAALIAPVPLKQALRLGRDLAEALVGVHAAGLVHRDLHPANLLLTTNGPALRIVDLARATAPVPPGDRSPQLPSDLHCVSPEQTGWQRYAIDPRSDLYSLGVILYRLISGTFPFEAADRLAWVHAHRARPATPLLEVMPELPPVVSDIVAKLLAKPPEARYQSARGLYHDLDRCLEAWDRTGRIEPFVLAERDIADRIEVSLQLYGREHELQALVRAHSRVAATGTSELVLVSGYSGIGKSSLVQALRTRLFGQGFFLSGKFDAASRDVPYATFAQALRALVQQLLGGNEQEVEGWSRRLQDALGENGQVLVEMVPELELLIGPQPPIPELRAMEAQNRFHVVFQQLLAALVHPHEPVVLFLDDLQWLDPGSLQLLDHLVMSGVRYLLLIGAYRDNEVPPTHPLALTLERMRSAGAPISTIHLGPLKCPELTTFIGDTLHCSVDEAASLAALVHDKTGGNPFFAIQFLLLAHDEGLVALDADAGRFRWDVEKIRSRNFTDNVVDFMLEKLLRLPPVTRQALACLACLGGGASERLLAVALEGLEKGEAALEPALRAGLASHIEGRFRFLHDRIQEAAYALVPEQHRPETHLAIGRRLLSGLSEREVADHVFDVVNQWNRGESLLTEAGDRETLLRLNRLAGQRARATAAYGSAHGYLAQALALQPPDAWSAHYDDTLTLHLELAECKSLLGAHDAANELLDVALAHVRVPTDGARVQRLRMRIHQLAGRPRAAVDVMVQALALLGETYPEDDEALEAAFCEEVDRIRTLLGDRPIADLVDAPLATDPRVKACIGLLEEGAPPAYTARPSLWPLITARATTLSLEHGNAEGSAFGYIGGALVLGAILGDWATAYELSSMALRLNERFESCRVQLHGKLLFHHAALVEIWRRPFAIALRHLEEAFPACVNAGDLVPAGYLTYNLVWLMFECGASPERIGEAARKYMAFARQNHNDLVYEVVRLEARFADVLAGANNVAPRDDAFDRTASIEALGRAGFDVGVAFAHVMDQVTAFLDGRYANALASGAQAARVLRSVTALAPQATHSFYLALAAVALYREGDAEAEHHMDILEDALDKHARWAENCPENFGNRHALLAAELARIEGREAAAAHLYEEAIHSARDNDFVHNEAIAWEAAARFYSDRGFDRIAETYRAEARARFERWGAHRKVQALTPSPPFVIASDAAGQTESLDLLAAIKASHTLSEEIVLDALVTRLMRIVLESAGAQRAALLLSRQAHEPLSLVAVASVDEHGVTVQARDGPPSADELPLSVVNLVHRSRERVLLPDVAPSPFANDPYLRQHQPASILCLPILRRAKLAGVLYLEHAVVEGVFTPDRVGLLELLATQAAISLENARLYTDLWRENHERQQAEAAARRIGDQLRQAQRMEAIGNLAGGIAHDFNNLLTLILSNSDFLLEEIAPDDSRREYVEEVQDAGKRAADLTRQLLAFSRKQILQPRVIDMNDVVDKMKRMLARLIGEDIELSVAPASDLDPVLVDPCQLEQIVLNLAVNSRDAMPTGGKLSIETANVLLDEQYVADHIGAAPGPHVMLAVRDTGTGMDSETQARLFEPFFTTKERGKGTGLGLATVFGIVQQSGGHISVQSTLGEGTVFRIYFPRTDANAAEASESSPKSRAARGTETILLVEDDEKVLALVHTVLRSSGYRVLAASAVRDALRLCDGQQSIDLLLSDVVMPRMRGPELAKRIRARRPDLKVLYMSGYADDAVVRNDLDSRTHFVQKPITPDALISEIRQLLDR